MPITIPCTVCKGKTTVPRQPPYNNANRYPFLAATEGSCEHCSGSGEEPVLSARALAIQAAQKAQGD